MYNSYESETDELVRQFQNFVIKRLEQDESSFVRCTGGCDCVFNGRFSEWSEWKEYPEDQIEIVTHTSMDDKKIVCD